MLKAMILLDIHLTFKSCMNTFMLTICKSSEFEVYTIEMIEGPGLTSITEIDRLDQKEGDLYGFFNSPRESQ